MIATGGTACAALQMIVEWGIQSEYSLLSDSVFLSFIYFLIVKNVKLLCILASTPGLERIRVEFPDLEVLFLVIAGLSPPYGSLDMGRGG